MATYIAEVRYNGKLEILEGLEYSSIRECKTELRANGYKVRIVATEEDFDRACERYCAKQERKSENNKIKYSVDKEWAKKYNCSVKVFRNAFKTHQEKDSNGEYVYKYMDLEDWVEYYKEHPEYCK